MCVLPKDLLRTIFSYTESKSVSETLNECVEFACKRMLDVEEMFACQADFAVSCHFMCKDESNFNHFTRPLWGDLEPHIDFVLVNSREQDKFKLTITVLWEDWQRPNLEWRYEDVLYFPLAAAKGLFDDFELIDTAPRSVTHARPADPGNRSLLPGGDRRNLRD